jgi:hypothetical protein
MSVILVQCGQCGNQLGFSILDALYSHLKPQGQHSPYSDDMRAFFRPSDDSVEAGLGFFGQSDYDHQNNSTINPSKLIARAICIDTEPKVVNNIYEKSCNKSHLGWEYNHENVLYRHGGAGNNWALGYQMCSGDFLLAIINAIIKEIKLSYINGNGPPLLLIVHSKCKPCVLRPLSFVFYVVNCMQFRFACSVLFSIAKHRHRSN